jgi:CheY-like chemotaxis protein
MTYVIYRAIHRVEAFADPACKLQAEFFAVVLTDFNMAAMNGIMLLRAARESGLMPHSL